MRKIREVLRLKFDGGQTNRRIARSCHISRPTVADYLLRFEEAGLTWPAAEALDDATLEHKLFPPAPAVSPKQRAVPRA
jgi:DNA-binding transcriptional regulator LsrR (DeoR family)